MTGNLLRYIIAFFALFDCTTNAQQPVTSNEASPKSTQTSTQENATKAVESFPAIEAFQAVAVDDNSIFAISNVSIGMYDKESHQRKATWEAPKDSLIKHMNSGVVHEGKLYCANSNWPKAPLVNTIEVFDASTLQHIEQRKFDEEDAAINWIDRHADSWWIAFAYYGEDADRTFVVRYDDHWKKLGTWRFPEQVIERFKPNSNSGGSFGSDRLLYATGHDHQELYALEVPTESGLLRYMGTISAPMEGQGIAWDRTKPNTLFGISRKNRHVLKMTVEIGTQTDSN